jgi:hypothetical protein
MPPSPVPTGSRVFQLAPPRDDQMTMRLLPGRPTVPASSNPLPAAVSAATPGGPQSALSGVSYQARPPSVDYSANGTVLRSAGCGPGRKDHVPLCRNLLQRSGDPSGLGPQADQPPLRAVGCRPYRGGPADRADYDQPGPGGGDPHHLPGTGSVQIIRARIGPLIRWVSPADA